MLQLKKQINFKEVGGWQERPAIIQNGNTDVHTTEIQQDWAVAGLALLDDTELHAISQAVTHTAGELEDKSKLHIFANSLTALKWMIDPSVHSSQVHSLNFLGHQEKPFGTVDRRLLHT